MAGKEYKTIKKTVLEKQKKGSKVIGRVSKAKSGKKTTLKKKSGKKAIKKVNKKVKIRENVEIKPIQEIIAKDVIENVVATPGIEISQNPILPKITLRSLNPFASKRNYFTIISFILLLIFFMGGYIYPATLDDMASNNVIWAGNEGKYDRGLFSQFYASIAFTMGVFLLGYYVNATFIRFNIKDWNYFSIGILLMFFFGLGRIGELVYDHNTFEGFKNIVLPVALIVLAFASYKIYKNMTGAI